MSLLNTFLNALRGISSNILRTALTTLGIIIGVASVIATLALGNGARAAVESNFRFLGSDQIQIDQNLKLEDGEMQAVGEELTYEDGLGIPAAASLVDRVEMQVGGSATPKCWTQLPFAYWVTRPRRIYSRVMIPSGRWSGSIASRVR